ncbi:MULTISPECIES: hypothetical protein [Pseudanabaena]|uniref:REase AHJR-like domain-containing protein n=2 Tax=Pseudanabaena TaxID=1152 RepID=L8MRJ7_9CYAN|nr:MULTISPECIES: hypothetical protein [Pseudanabaena]ELS30537.1 hypothetical protein Pse7429DRAFT_4377 [Pseudanabaena biceps PCC 7429]MDG3497191.1 hypothetical protein [Pseudanabaena catenata USMAC16]
MIHTKVVECYSSQGYEVIRQPHAHQLPFNLNAYSPDLLVKISESQGLIVAIKDRANNLEVAHYRTLAQRVAEHSGWRFLLITGEDATPIAEEDIADDKLTRSQILHRKERIAKLISIGEHEPAFLSLWIFAEVLMRRHARQALIPIDRLPTILMIHHLYDQSEISIDQFERAIALNEIRNRVAHGFPVKSINLNVAIEKLLNLVDEFIAMEKP